jgi:hypothetical protein
MTLDPNHQRTRGHLSRGGIVAVAIGAPCALIGIILFLSCFFADAANDMDSVGRRAVIGLIMAGFGGFATVIGLNLLGFAHMGRIARYQAGETMPVAKDALRDATPALGEVARNISAAVRGDAPGKIRHSCGAYNDPDDQFCKGCGAPLQSLACPKCGSPNDADARFCDKCGAPLAAANHP